VDLIVVPGIVPALALLSVYRFLRSLSNKIDNGIINAIINTIHEITAMAEITICVVKIDILNVEYCKIK
jgi:hypothetical protein